MANKLTLETSHLFAMSSRGLGYSEVLVRLEFRLERTARTRNVEGRSPVRTTRRRIERIFVNTLAC